MKTYDCDTFFLQDKHHVLVTRIFGDVHTPPFAVGAKMVGEDGSEFNILQVEWFTLSFATPNTRSIGVIVDREAPKGKYHYLPTEVDV